MSFIPESLSRLEKQLDFFESHDIFMFNKATKAEKRPEGQKLSWLFYCRVRWLPVQPRPSPIAGSFLRPSSFRLPMFSPGWRLLSAFFSWYPRGFDTSPSAPRRSYSDSLAVLTVTYLRGIKPTAAVSASGRQDLARTIARDG